MRKLIAGDGFNHLVQGAHGYLLFNVNDKYIGRSIEKHGEWSPHEVELFRKLVRPGAYVVEVGAHIGSLTLPLARFAGPSGRVFAFEPQRLLFQVLAANAALNSLTNVYPHHVALGNKSGTAWLSDAIDYSKPANYGGVPLRRLAELAGEAARYEVQISRLDDIYRQPRLDVLKIDVEGMEADVIRGAEALIRQHHPYVYVENDRVEKSPELMTLLQSFGYRLFWHLPPLHQDLFPSVVSVNMLCVHESHSIRINARECRATDPHPLAKKRATAGR